MNGKLSPLAFQFVSVILSQAISVAVVNIIKCHGVIGNKARHYISEIKWPCTMFVIGQQSFLNVVLLLMR